MQGKEAKKDAPRSQVGRMQGSSVNLFDIKVTLTLQAQQQQAPPGMMAFPQAGMMMPGMMPFGSSGTPGSHAGK